MTAQEEAAYAQEFKNSNFYRNVFLPHREQQKIEILNQYTKAILEEKTNATANLSGRYQFLNEDEEWLQTIFNRPLETKGS